MLVVHPIDSVFLPIVIFVVVVEVVIGVVFVAVESSFAAVVSSRCCRRVPRARLDDADGASRHCRFALGGELLQLVIVVSEE
jgi:hypothetical protein